MFSASVALVLLAIGIAVAAFFLPETWQNAGLLLAAAGAFLQPVIYMALLRACNPRRTDDSRSLEIEHWPSVTLLVAAFNERSVIRQKIENAVATRYDGRFEIVVASDGSDDGTDEIVGEFRDQGVRLYRNPHRTGKAGCLRRAIAEVSTDVVVFSDANAFYEPDATASLVRALSGPGVGAATGDVALIEASTGNDEAMPQNECPPHGRGESVWVHDLEKRTMILESAAGSTVGVDGAMVAVRRSLVPVFDDGIVLDDFLLGMSVVNQGYRVVFAPDARGWEFACPTLRGEYERRARIMAGVLQLFRERQGLPLRGSGVVWRFVGHKLWRWCAPLYAIAFACVLLARFGWVATVIGALGALLLLFTILAAWIGPRRGASKLGYAFAFFAGSVAGLARGLLGLQKGAWRRTDRS